MALSYDAKVKLLHLLSSNVKDCWVYITQNGKEYRYEFKGKMFGKTKWK